MSVYPYRRQIVEEIKRYLTENGASTRTEMAKGLGVSREHLRKSLDDCGQDCGWLIAVGVTGSGRGTIYAVGKAKDHILGHCRLCGKRNFAWGLKNQNRCGQCLGIEGEPRLQTPEPCEATPGTEGKVAVLCERFDQGFELWHPEDGGRE